MLRRPGPTKGCQANDDDDDDDTVALLALLYGSENWTIKARDTKRITAAEMKYMRKTSRYIWTYYKTDPDIAKELNTNPVLDKTHRHKKICCYTQKECLVIDY